MRESSRVKKRKFVLREKERSLCFIMRGTKRGDLKVDVSFL